MGVRCLTVVVHRSHQASASPILPTRSSHLPLVSHSPRHNSKCRSNHNNKDSLLLGEFVSWTDFQGTECNTGLLVTSLDWLAEMLSEIMQAGQGLLVVEVKYFFI
jgi:hypothetical protein